MTKQTKLDKKQLAIMAAILGISNAGKDDVFVGYDPQVPPEDVKRYYDKTLSIDVQGAVYMFGQNFLENEEMADMFVDEAKSWTKRLRYMTIDEIKSTWKYSSFVDALLEVTELSDAAFIKLVNKTAKEMDGDSDYCEAVSLAMQLGATKHQADLVARELGRIP